MRSRIIGWLSCGRREPKVREVVPVEYVLAAIPWSELVTDADGSRRVRLPSGVETLPVVTITDWEGEWPARINQ